jgi:hypothetical protein
MRKEESKELVALWKKEELTGSLPYRELSETGNIKISSLSQKRTWYLVSQKSPLNNSSQIMTL